MTNFVLRLRNVFNNNGAYLENLNLNISEGEIYGIICEEETSCFLTDILTGQKKLTSGEIEISNKLEQIRSIRNAQNKGIGMTYSGNQLMLNLSVGENIFYSSMKSIISRSRLLKNVKALIDELKLEIDIYAKAGELKAKERFYVDLLRALFLNPKIVIISQLKGFAIDTLNTIRKVLIQLARKNISFLIFSNRVDEMLFIVDKIAIIKDGKLSDFMLVDDIKKNQAELARLLIGRVDESICNSPNSYETEIFQLIIKINELIAAQRQLSEIFDFLAERIVKITGCSYCHIGIFDEQSDSIYEEGKYELVKHKFEYELVREVALHGNLVYRDQLERLNTVILSDGLGFSAVSICAPIKLQTRIIGTIQIGFNKSQFVNKELLSILEAFCYQVSTAVESSRLAIKSTLIMEAHHRIKNNLQSIISLLLIEKGNDGKKDIDSIIEKTVSRIKAMAAVDELLSKRDNVSGMINLRELINFLVYNIIEVPKESCIKIELNLMDYYIRYSKATSIILAINELIMNCIKHAFPPEYAAKSKQICIDMREKAHGIEIIISDNGVGIDQDIEGIFLKSLGLRLINSLVTMDLGAQFQIHNLVENNSTKGFEAVILIDKQYLGSKEIA